jgi:WD40 repeat protein
LKILDFRLNSQISIAANINQSVLCPIVLMSDNIVAYATDDHKINVTDLRTHQHQALNGKHTKNIHSLVLMRTQEKILLSGSRDETINVWNLNDSNPPLQIKCGENITSLCQINLF